MKSKLAKGALFVTIATLIVKILSIVYKIPYQNITGDKGFYIYQQMYPFFALVVASAHFAIPLAISDSKRKEEVMGASFYLLIIFSLFMSLMIIVLNPFLGKVLGDTLLSPLFYPLIPLLLLLPMVAIIRGYFYLNVKMISKVGISIILEQFFRILTIIFVLFCFLNTSITNLYDVAFYSLFGFSIGLVVSLLYMSYQFDYRWINLKHYHIHSGVIIIKRSFFLLISASFLLFIQMIDSFTIIHQLIKITTSEEAMVIKGVYDRGLPIIQSAVFFVSPLLSSVIPHVQYKKDYGKLFMFILYLALPATIGLIFVLKDLNQFLFQDTKYTSVLQINAVVVLLYALFLTYTSMIKNNKIIFSVISCGLIIKLLGNMILIEPYGISGAAFSSVLCFIIMLLLMVIINNNHLKLEIYLLIKIILSSLFMFSLLILSSRFSFLNHLIIQVLIGIISYLLISMILRIKRKDFMINYSKEA